MMADDKNVEKDLLDIDDFDALEIRNDPNIYLHHAILSLQRCLRDDNIKEGFMKYRLYAEHIEMIAKAADLLPENYDDEIRDYKLSDDYVRAGGEDVKGMRLSNKKMLLIMKQVWSNKVVTNPLKF